MTVSLDVLTDLAARLESATADQQHSLIEECAKTLFPNATRTWHKHIRIMLYAHAYESAAIMICQSAMPGWEWSINFDPSAKDGRFYDANVYDARNVCCGIRETFALALCRATVRALIAINGGQE